MAKEYRNTEERERERAQFQTCNVSQEEEI
jgi:hypothetical protein